MNDTQDRAAQDGRKNFYLTTTLPYVNADPHIGFALEMVQADVIARRARAAGMEVVFNTGTDEHGAKIYRRALEEKKEPQAYVDEWAAKFDRLKGALDLSYTHFIRTTDPHHIVAAQEFWKRCAAAGDIEKRLYKIKYCVGCEMEKTESELVDGKCPIHPATPIEEIEEENYFFKFSRYGEKLLSLYRARPDFVVPDFRLKEISSFVEQGLQDFSISRLKDKMPWGIPVPGDEAHVMYVWFDALVNYVSTLGWPENEKNFSVFWPGVQIAGKDNLRQQSAIWQAMLMSAGLPPSKQIIIHGFITHDGQKMSKSVGNVVDPFSLVETYGTDAVRYFLLREASPFEDLDFSQAKFEERYRGDLQNGLGNLVARVAALGARFGTVPISGAADAIARPNARCAVAAEGYRFNEALQCLWEDVRALDKYVSDQKLWEQEEWLLKQGIAACGASLLSIAHELEPYLPGTARKIKEQFALEGDTLRITKAEPLFPRIG